jgi:hypothetical protein
MRPGIRCGAAAYHRSASCREALTGTSDAPRLAAIVRRGRFRRNAGRLIVANAITTDWAGRMTDAIAVRTTRYGVRCGR